MGEVESKHFNVSIPFYDIDIRDKNKLKQFFGGQQFSAVDIATCYTTVGKIKNHQGIFIFKKLAYVQ